MDTVTIYQVNLSESDLKNIALLLDRAELKGSEVPAYVRVRNAITNARAFKVPKDKNIKNTVRLGTDS